MAIERIEDLRGMLDTEVWAEIERLNDDLAYERQYGGDCKQALSEALDVLKEIAEGCGHTRCHAYPWIRMARKALA